MRDLWKSAGQFESIVRDGFSSEEDTSEDFPIEELVEGVNRELDLMKSFPVFHQTVPRAKVSSIVWSTRWCHKRKGPKQMRALSVVRQFATSLDANFSSPTPGLEVTSFVSDGSVEREFTFCSVILVLLS